MTAPSVEAALASKYLDFKEIADTGKTKGYRLAKIKWHGPWRCYVFVPDPETVWNVDDYDDTQWPCPDVARVLARRCPSTDVTP